MKYSFKAILKYVLIKLMAGLMKCFYVFPMNRNKILFFSFDGKQYSDNPKYICEELIRSKYQIEWAFCDVDKFKPITPSNVTVIRIKSLRFLYEFFTAHVIVTNDFIPSYLTIRKKQILLNTWHGGSPLKTVGKRDQAYQIDDALFFKLHEKKYSAFLSSSSFMTKEVFDESFGFKGEVLEYGMPRNDILINYDDSVIKKVFSYFNLCKGNDEYGLVLYAPTFRGKGEFLPKYVQLDIKRTLTVLEKKYGKKYYFLFRAHHAMKLDCLVDEAIDASDYPDMQELLVASDVLITDYSSCMGDFALTRKPVFLYIPDIKTYMRDRGFYWDIYGLPFETAENQKQLEQRIREFNEEIYCQKIDNYFAKLNTFEKGNATQMACLWLENKMKEKM